MHVVHVVHENSLRRSRSNRNENPLLQRMVAVVIETWRCCLTCSQGLQQRIVTTSAAKHRLSRKTSLSKFFVLLIYPVESRHTLFFLLHSDGVVAGASDGRSFGREGSGTSMQELANPQAS